MKAKNFDHIPETLTGAIRYFGDADKCHEFMVTMRWSSGIRCPHCNSDNIGKLVQSRRIWNCKACRKQFTVKVGTIFEDSPLGLDKWLPATWLIVNAKNGNSSCELARDLGVTQKTGWFMLHRIRLAMQNGSLGKSSGRVEADETYIGAKARYMHKDKRTGVGHAGLKKTAVQGILERTTPDKHSQVVLKIVDNTRRPELCGNVRAHMSSKARRSAPTRLCRMMILNAITTAELSTMPLVMRKVTFTRMAWKTSGACSNARCTERM